jgi:hypothetical protein
MYKLLMACLVAGPAAGLAACSPPYYPQNRVDWQITNHTADTLLLSVGYPLDSELVAPADVPLKRQAQTDDSLLQGYVGQRYPRFPLEHLVWHRGHWYWMRSAFAPLSPDWSDAKGHLHAAIVNRTAGILTYKLVPGGEHSLAGQYCLPCDTLPPALPPLVSVRLRQGRTQRALPVGRELNQLFRAQPHLWRAWLDWGKPTTYGYELRVGPGLTLNDE